MQGVQRPRRGAIGEVGVKCVGLNSQQDKLAKLPDFEQFKY